MDRDIRKVDWNDTTNGKSLSSELDYLIANSAVLSLASRIYWALRIIQYIYYPVLAIVGVPVNSVTIIILSRRKCGLSNCVTNYLVAMAAADLLVVIIDLIFRHIPIVYRDYFSFLYSIPLCNIHSILLYAVTDCSVWFTVAFTFDRFVAICWQKLNSKYCTERTAAVVITTVTVLSCLSNIFWYFMLTDRYLLGHSPWFCAVTIAALLSRFWITIESLHYILNPCVPFLLILLLNVFTVRHIVVASRSRRRLLDHNSGESSRDQEIENRRKSMILLFVISANFIVLWAMLMLYSIWYRMSWLGNRSMYLHKFVQDIGFMLQILSCCTNTGIYAVTQTKFRDQLNNFVKYPFLVTVKFIK
ncbi:probable G-protein coupled receptor 139 [Scyliorhinus torazame]|uniref:probable G-protein coupled receptor 139 n=1 Tax=Scyliorhinus torazame TaxID=75743 RepID=UPI003B5AB446